MSDFEGVPDFGGLSARKAKREYRYAMCKSCNHVVNVATITIGYLCGNCGKYNDATESFKRYDENPELIASSPNFPALVRVNADKLNYTKFRDEHAIRSDLYVKGIRRDTVGPSAFKKQLKAELVRNKCYRGQDSGC